MVFHFVGAEKLALLGVGVVRGISYPPVVALDSSVGLSLFF